MAVTTVASLCPPRDLNLPPDQLRACIYGMAYQQQQQQQQQQKNMGALTVDAIGIAAACGATQDVVLDVLESCDGEAGVVVDTQQRPSPPPPGEWHAVVDVVEVVLEYADDVRTLRECRGVCRRWALATRRYVTRHFCDDCDAENGGLELCANGVLGAPLTHLSARREDPSTPADMGQYMYGYEWGVVIQRAVNAVSRFAVRVMLHDMHLGIDFAFGQSEAAAGSLPVVTTLGLTLSNTNAVLDALLREDDGAPSGLLTNVRCLQLDEVTLSRDAVDRLDAAMPGLSQLSLGQCCYGFDDADDFGHLFDLLRDRLEAFTYQTDSADIAADWLDRMGHCPELRAFDLKAPMEGAAGCLDALRPERMPQLSTLAIQCPDIDCAALSALVGSRTLKHVRIVDWAQTGALSVGRGGAQVYAALCPLESLGFTSDVIATDGDMAEILKRHGPTLSKLNLWFCTRLGDGTLRLLAACAPRLTDLDLTGIGPAMTDAGLLDLIRAGPPLRRLALPCSASGGCLARLWAALGKTLEVLVLPSKIPVRYSETEPPPPPHMLVSHRAELRVIVDGGCRVECEGKDVGAGQLIGPT